MNAEKIKNFLLEMIWKIIFWGVFALIFWGISYLIYRSDPESLWMPLIPFYYAYSYGKGIGIIIFVIVLAIIMEIKDLLKKR